MNLILFTAKTQSALSFFIFSLFAETPNSENHQALRAVMISSLKSQKPNFYLFAAQLLCGFPLSSSQRQRKRKHLCDLCASSEAGGEILFKSTRLF
jgi:hypothetical protein